MINNIEKTTCPICDNKTTANRIKSFTDKFDTENFRSLCDENKELEAEIQDIKAKLRKEETPFGFNLLEPEHNQLNKDNETIKGVPNNYTISLNSDIIFRVENLNELTEDLLCGIAVSEASFILFEFKESISFSKILIGGLKKECWEAEWGVDSHILISIDNKTWKDIALIPQEFAYKAALINLKSLYECKYVKIVPPDLGLVGIGYIKLIN